MRNEFLDGDADEMHVYGFFFERGSGNGNGRTSCEGSTWVVDRRMGPRVFAVFDFNNKNLTQLFRRHSGLGGAWVQVVPFL